MKTKKIITLVSAALLALSLTACAGETKVLTRAEGQSQSAPAEFPAVTLADNGAPAITPIAAAAPSDLKIATLIKGSGQAVTADQTVTIQYSGYLWTGEKFDSSWDSGSPATFPLSGVIPGFAKAIEGQTIGSQVITIIPPALGYQDQAVGSIPANSTLIFVIDILAAK